MSYNPQTGLAYYPAIHMASTFTDSGIDLEHLAIATQWRRSGVGGQFVSGASRPDASVASLQAWDPVRQQLAWEVRSRWSGTRAR